MGHGAEYITKHRPSGRSATARVLSGLDIVAVDLKTVSPPHDVQNMTAFLAAQVIYESLALLCRRDTACGVRVE
jgi:arginase family enzyme